MFEKLLAVLPYNPGLLQQMSFYSHRMRAEAAIRRTGMIFVVLAFFIQFFAVLNPPQSTSAASGSNNDIIKGGVSSAADARAQCIRDTQGFQKILHAYDISCDAFNPGRVKYIGNLPATGPTKPYWSVGHLDYGFKEDFTVNISGAGTLHWRHLDSFGPATYEAYQVTAGDGEVYYILKGCANLVSAGKPVRKQTQEGVFSGGTTLTNTPTITTPAPVTPPPDTPVTPIEMCPLNITIPKADPRCVACPYNPSILKEDGRCFQPCPYNSAIPITSPQCFEPCPYNNAIAKSSSLCKPCDKSKSQQDAASCVIIHKRAANITAKLADANGSTANPGDVITYTLSAQNTGKATIKQFTFQENISDVLDYANLTDPHGGTVDGVGNISWPSQSIAAGATVTQAFTVTVKNPIPTTPADPHDPGHFDLTMTNVYGDTVNIKVPAPPIKAVQVATANLPNTGPGTTAALAASIVIITGYFYGRARLLARESQLAIQENSGA